jgi:hypothetical protein
MSGSSTAENPIATMVAAMTPSAASTPRAPPRCWPLALSASRSWAAYARRRSGPGGEGAAGDREGGAAVVHLGVY